MSETAKAKISAAKKANHPMRVISNQLFPNLIYNQLWGYNISSILLVLISCLSLRYIPKDSIGAYNNKDFTY